MKYKDLLKKYKEGLVSEEEKLIVEQDIEKYEAIEEYLSNIIDDELVDLTELTSIEKNTDETLKLKKSVNKRLRKLVFSSVATVLTLLFAVFFVVSPFIDTLYYNPSKISVGKADKDIDFDLKAITELNMPGYTVSTTHVERQRFGTYDIDYFYRNTFNNNDYNVSSKIKRGEIYTTNKDILDSNFIFIDVQIPIRERKYIEEQKEEVLNHIKQLNPVSYVSAALTFENDLTMEELYNLESKYSKVRFIWAGIRTDSSDKETMDSIGIQLNGDGVHLDDDIEEKYKAFTILKWLVNPVGSSNSDKPLKAQAYELHYKSLLQYVIDREEAVNVIERRPWKNEFYQSALKYAEDYGVKTYGVLVYAEARDLIELVENEKIKLLEFNEAMVSKKNIQ